MIRMIQIIVLVFFCNTVGLVSGAGLNKISIDFVTVGNPNNPENVAPKFGDGSTGYGSVDYAYRIGTYEVTNDQYTAFLNAVASSDDFGLYLTAMETSFAGGISRSGESGSYTYTAKQNFGNKPVNFVSFFDAARFSNWIHNGQQDDAATTEFGAYTFSGIETVSGRNPNARFFIPDEHEWQKAAFYQPGADTLLGDGWWRRAGAQDFAVPTEALVNATGDVINSGPLVANFGRNANWNGSETASFDGSALGNVTTVGSAGIKSYYGGYDFFGNVFELVVADPTKPDPNGYGPYTVLGGSFRNAGHFALNERNLVHHVNHTRVANNTGFRLAATVPIILLPEPSGFAIASFATLLSVASRRRARARKTAR